MPKGIYDHRFKWTDERIDFTRAHWRDGNSATEIAALLPLQPGEQPPSRSAVLGKVRRMGELRREHRRTKVHHRKNRELDRGHAAFVRAAPYQAERMRKLEKSRNFNALESKREARKRDPGYVPPPRQVEVPSSKRLSLFELTDHICKFPVDGDKPPYHYCGNDAEPERPYCAYHCSIAYVMPPLRKRNRNNGYWLRGA